MFELRMDPIDEIFSSKSNATNLPTFPNLKRTSNCFLTISLILSTSCAVSLLLVLLTDIFHLLFLQLTFSSSNLPNNG